MGWIACSFPGVECRSFPLRGPSICCMIIFGISLEAFFLRVFKGLLGFMLSFLGFLRVSLGLLRYIKVY